VLKGSFFGKILLLASYNNKALSKMSVLLWYWGWFLMFMKKRFFVPAIVFLAIAIAAPSAILFYNNSLNYGNIVVNNPNGKITSGNISIAQGYQLPQGISNTVPLAIGVVFGSLAIIFFYFGYKRP
jgi:hypothetical protein